MTFPDAPRTGFFIPPLIAAALALVLLASGPAAVQAQETITILGRVVAGTRDAVLPSGIPVLLLISNPAGGLVATSQTTTGPGGGFQLDQVPRTEDGIYALSVDYAGVFYSTSLGLQDLSNEVRLTVYESTQDAAVVKVTRQVLVITGVDEKNREISALEFVLLTNTSDRTLLPDLSNPATLSFLRFALPSQAEALDVRSDLPGGDIVTIGTGFALTSAVPPGDHSVDFSFRFPYRGDSVSYRQSLPQGAEVYQVLVPQGLTGVTVTPLRSISPVNIGTSLYLAWEGREFEPGQGIVLELTNLPQPSLAARLETSITDGTFWKIAIPSAVGAILAFLLLFGTLKGHRRETVPATTGSDGITGEVAQRDALVREVAALDEQFQQGDVVEADYHQQREGLIARILGPVGQTDGEDAETPAEPPRQ